MDTTAKGNDLEDAFYQYLKEQEDRGELVFGLYPAALCQIHKKKSYFCRERQNNVEFDVVIELRREAIKEPHLIVVFECKNYKDSIPETEITDFSDKLTRIGRHNTKGVIVTKTKLQSGAQNVAANRKIGIVKFNEHGIDFIAERRSQQVHETQYIKNLIVANSSRSKPLKFSAFFDDRYYDSIQTFVAGLSGEDTLPDINSNTPVPFIAYEKIDQ